ncbi:MAG: UDP-glucose 4-epimerase GalE [Bacilli bacterium]|jgi:UDP-glucose 4-epimerase
MAILVTGGTGYIGSHTVCALLEADYEVVIVDNLSNSKLLVLDRIIEITGKRPRFYEVDCTDETALDGVFAKESISSVIHFAGLKAVGESVELPLKYYRNNLDGTLVLLGLMKRHGVHNFVFSSSATVYGNPKSVPIYETDEVGGTTNPYGTSKYFIERIVSDFVLVNPGFNAVILRYFNPVGAHPSGRIGEDPSGIPNNLMPFITQVAIGKLINLGVFGNDYRTLDGTGVRDYLHVVDLAEGHLAALRLLEKKQGGTFVYNLGTGHGTSVLQMIAAFEKANGIKIPYVIMPRRPGDIDACYANCDKAKRELKWTAHRSIEEACRDAWNWQKNNPQGYGE